MKSKKILRRALVWAPLGLLLLCLAGAAAAAASNRTIPQRSSVVDRLSSMDKALLAEAAHLRQELGAAVFPGWEQAEIPFIVYNEGYVFLAGYPGSPPDGWKKMPQNEARGGPWEAVPGDDFFGQPYYRQPLSDPSRTPEAFTVLVGEHWAATFTTSEYSLISFAAGFRQDLPPLLRPVVPYRLVYNLLMQGSEGYLAALLHESFHAYQATAARQRFDASELVMHLEGSYPWESGALEQPWQAELDALADAVQADSQAGAAERAQQFLALRDSRREDPALTPELVDFERQREWLEGMAKYAELEIGAAAANSSTYEPLPDMRADPSFNAYRSRPQFRQQQTGELRRMLTHEGEIRFYYTGMAQAMLLDRLDPGWQARLMQDGIWLEDLLRVAVDGNYEDLPGDQISSRPAQPAPD